jgi:serine/threonine protein kinase
LISVDEYRYEALHFVTLTEEFLNGGTLTSKGKITRAQCIAIGSCLIDALGHTASLGLVHRDIKPDNIMFRQDGATPVLTDFGVARDLLDSSLTPTWAPRGPGTPFFASPEQLNNQKHLIDWRCDQFGLGISLSFVTLGIHPYLPENGPDHTVVDLVAGRKGPTDQFIAAIRSIGLTALQKMVASWPIHRYRTPPELANAWASQGRNT